MSREWACSVCTFLNLALVPECETCGYARDGTPRVETRDPDTPPKRNESAVGASILAALVHSQEEIRRATSQVASGGFRVPEGGDETVEDTGETKRRGRKRKADVAEDVPPAKKARTARAPAAATKTRRSGAKAARDAPEEAAPAAKEDNVDVEIAELRRAVSSGVLKDQLGQAPAPAPPSPAPAPAPAAKGRKRGAKAEAVAVAAEEAPAPAPPPATRRGGRKAKVAEEAAPATAEAKKSRRGKAAAVAEPEPEPEPEPAETKRKGRGRAKEKEEDAKEKEEEGTQGQKKRGRRGGAKEEAAPAARASGRGTRSSRRAAGGVAHTDVAASLRADAEEREAKRPRIVIRKHVPAKQELLRIYRGSFFVPLKSPYKEKCDLDLLDYHDCEWILAHKSDGIRVALRQRADPVMEFMFNMLCDASLPPGLVVAKFGFDPSAPYAPQWKNMHDREGMWPFELFLDMHQLRPLVAEARANPHGPLNHCLYVLKEPSLWYEERTTAPLPWRVERTAALVVDTWMGTHVSSLARTRTVASLEPMEEEEGVPAAALARTTSVMGTEIVAVDPSDMPLPPPPPRGLSGKTMFSYQLRAYGWMKDVERLAPKGMYFEVPFPAGSPVAELGTLPDRLYSRGGIFADEMGLGKTLVGVALILGHPRRAGAPPLNRERCVFESSSTLIVCPSHLAKQWADEIAGVSSLRTAVVSTISQLSALTYGSARDMDVVIVTHAFLSNTSYTSACGDLEGIHKRPPGYAVDEEEMLRMNCPILQKIGWHRIILDEGHEVMHETKFKEVFGSFMSDYRWYVTGTPLPKGQTSMEGAIRFLEMYTEGEVQPQQPAYDKVLYETIKRYLFWRSTKASVKDEMSIPDVVEETIFLKLTEVEMAMYRSAAVTKNRTRMRQICCHPQISASDRALLGEDGKTLEQIRMVMVESSLNNLKRAQAALLATTTEITFTEDRYVRIKTEITDGLAEETRADKVAKLAERLKELEKNTEDARKKLKKELERSEKELRDCTSISSFFDALVPRATEMLAEPCAVCLEEIGEAGMTSCGHLFCIMCIRTTVRSVRNCPMCRKPLTETDVTPVRSKEDARAPPDELTFKHGVKMARLIRYLRGILAKDASTRAIVFSQWDNMLQRVGATLASEGIESVYCKGNVHSRNKVIESFKREGGPRIIMLSLENAASGTNLTEAKYVIFVDPIDGTRENARAQETQALGRAHRLGQGQQVTMVRLITEGTVEQEIYDSTH